MIKLNRPATVPACIDGSSGLLLTDRFKASGEAVWAIDELKLALSDLSSSKCCYCEIGLGTRAAFMEVEHFKHKDKYPDDVVRWDNLLPSCKRCNAKKGMHDVVAEPIIDPSVMAPRDHLALDRYYYRSKTTTGAMTLEVLEFNIDLNFMTERFKLCLTVRNKLADLCEIAGQPLQLGGARKLRNRFRAFLKQALPGEPFAGTLATELLSNGSELDIIISCLKSHSLWDVDFQHTIGVIESISLKL